MPQFWIGGVDVNGVLTEIGGWAVGCYNERQASEAVTHAINAGWVGGRTHYCPDGTTWPAYELSDAGLERVRELYGDQAYYAQLGKRQWYRDRMPHAPASPPAVA